ncbi:sugar fermentation stimulation protein [Hydrogenobacter thermophilus TK-6]|uniref:Sugar fermentation stimulation protein homolog n=1 Tax=Hydrogenobacter thermophilus (strain DSM 6534 / IAM 12695 / TK-6) TaxID=608538 RepID=D3DG48_HYDTT|nr:DNA/RNA nuclease SfsA [Hydrogenobacter thermophilus]ADO44735.1 sugar fermentation stimulation protein [Hydrogenobacter thermophilus TK-6]BAI68800.1 sugar fermentation stimulation protein [Hydrogenobacter thermophilus TK-6]
MRFPSLVSGEFVKRINRFVCVVRIKDKEHFAYLRNTGRLSELLKEGTCVYLKEKDKGKYSYELLLAEGEKGILVCLDSQIAPKLYAEGLPAGELVYEPKVVGGKLDLLVGKELIEVKSVNLVRDGIALFPDAPTQRGSRHIDLLIKAYPKYTPKMVFVIQREDAYAFSPNREMDPIFANKLKVFKSLGHRVVAYNCKVSLEEIKLKEEVEVLWR